MTTRTELPADHAHGVYLGQRLVFRDTRSEGDRTLATIGYGRLFLRYLAITALAAAVANLLWLIFYREAAIDKSIPVMILLWVLFASLRTSIWASHWQLLVDDAADNADVAFAAIGQAARERRIPADITPRRLMRPGRPRKDYLLLRDGSFLAYVSVSAYGTGLYLGWSMWRRESFLSMLWLRIKLIRFSDVEFRMHLAADDARALRESVHGVVQAGLHAAQVGTGPSIAQVYGSHLLTEQERPGLGQATPVEPENQGA